jgi:hypothetical protein
MANSDEDLPSLCHSTFEIPSIALLNTLKTLSITLETTLAHRASPGECYHWNDGLATNKMDKLNIYDLSAVALTDPR